MDRNSLTCTTIESYSLENHGVIDLSYVSCEADQFDESASYSRNGKGDALVECTHGQRRQREHDTSAYDGGVRSGQVQRMVRHWHHQRAQEHHHCKECDRHHPHEQRATIFRQFRSIDRSIESVSRLASIRFDSSKRCDDGHTPNAECEESESDRVHESRSLGRNHYRGISRLDHVY